MQEELGAGPVQLARLDERHPQRSRLLHQRHARHKSLGQRRTPRTPAMAIGLSDHVWSYREYVWLPVHTAPVLTKQMDERIACLPAIPADSLVASPLDTNRTIC